jgi:hypothetical protein
MQMRAILRANELRRIQDRRGGATAAPKTVAQQTRRLASFTRGNKLLRMASYHIFPSSKAESMQTSSIRLSSASNRL